MGYEAAHGGADAAARFLALQGFRSQRREGIELTAGFTATVNGELQVGDVCNALNSSSILTIGTAFGSRWRQPTAIVDPRIVQLSAQLTF